MGASSTGHPASGARRTDLAIAAVALTAFTAYVLEYLQYLPEADNTGGPDYSYFLTQLLAGYYWYANNGLFSIPWFTPAFCAGVPYFANMQAMYLSLPQFLSFIVNPVLALQITFVTFAAVGFASFYVLARRAFCLSPWIALAGSVMFLFNEFYPTRFVIGHLTFHAFMLMPVVAAAALARGRSTEPQKIFDQWVLLGALVLAYMVQSGMVHALPPSLLAVGAILLIHGYLFGLRVNPFARLMVMGGIALILSASKLVAGIAFLSQFPREMIPLSGFGTIWQSLYIAVYSVFIEPPFIPAAAWIQNNQWFPDTKIFLSLHEFEYGVSFIPAFVILTWAAAKVVRRIRKRATVGNELPTSRFARGMVVCTLGLTLTIPLLLNWYQPDWNALLKSTPVLGNSSTMTRWLSLYIPIVILISAIALDREKAFFKVRALVAVTIASIVIVNTLTTSREYYERRGDYNFGVVADAHRDALRGVPIPAVERVDWPMLATKELMYRRDRNESFVTGGTNAMCYEPMFGHRLEEFPYGPLRQGPALEISDGRTNIKNPACMLYPEANECRPGDHFAESEIASATAFVNYKPFPFEMPWWQKLANGVSLFGLFATMGCIVLFGFRYVRGLRRKSTSLASESPT